MIVSSTHRTRQWSLVMLPRFQHGGIIDEIIIKLTSVLLCFMLCNLVLALLAGCMQLRSPDCCAFSVHDHQPRFRSNCCIILPRFCNSFTGRFRQCVFISATSLQQTVTAKLRTAHSEEEEEGFYKFLPANTADRLCQSWQSCSNHHKI